MIDGLLQPLKYLWNTVTREIQDEITILSDITQYYRQQLKEHLETRQKTKKLKSIMAQAQHYKQWKAIAEHYDQIPQVKQITNEVYSPYYDYEYLQTLIQAMSHARGEGDAMKLIGIIRSHSDRNVANCNCPYLYRHSFNHSKRLIQQYHQELAKSFQAIMKADISQGRKVEFFGEVRHAVGRSALLLSGGAIMGMYHIGVVQALIEADCLPKIIAGSSAGSIIASILATHTREDLLKAQIFNFNAFIGQKRFSLFEQFRRMGREGAALDIKILETFLRDNIGDYTFQEAYDKFGIILNITVTGVSEYDPDRLLNYLTAPNVLIWSASAASCAIPYIYGATDLYCKDHKGAVSKYTLMNRKFLDGSIGHDLPMDKLSILFNVNNFIVSQTNPWVIPFMDYTDDIKGLGNPLLFPLMVLLHRSKEFVLSQLKHRTSQLAYVFPNDITKFCNIITQVYVGNITIWPKPKLDDYRRIMDNPTSYEAVLSFVMGGRQRTYPKIQHIRSTMFMQKQIDKCYRFIRNNSRIHFLHSNKDIEDAGEEEFVMKRVFEEEQEWQEDDDDSSFPRRQVPSRRTKIKPLTRNASIEEDNISRMATRNGKLQMRRNESYLLPRERSFQS